MSAMDHDAALAVEFGPRGSTTEGEARAAEYAGKVLADCGLEPEFNRFTNARSAWHPYALFSRLMLLALADEVGGAIVPDDDGNFLTQLARAVLDDQDLPDLQTLFATSQMETASPLGSPTAESPMLPVYTTAQLRAMWEADREARAGNGRARVAEQIAAGQMAMDALFAPAA